MKNLIKICLVIFIILPLFLKNSVFAESKYFFLDDEKIVGTSLKYILKKYTDIKSEELELKSISLKYNKRLMKNHKYVSVCFYTKKPIYPSERIINNKKTYRDNICLTMNADGQIINDHVIPVSYSVRGNISEVPVSMKSGSQFKNEFSISIPKKYDLSIEFDRSTKQKQVELQNFFGKFSCWNTRHNTPCGKFSKYSVSWSIISENTKINGVSNEYSRGKRSSAKNILRLCIGSAKLGYGKHKVVINWNSGLEVLKHLNPKVVIRPSNTLTF